MLVFIHLFIYFYIDFEEARVKINTEPPFNCGQNNPGVQTSLVFTPLVEHLGSICLFRNTGNSTWRAVQGGVPVREPSSDRGDTSSSAEYATEWAPRT